ncbi:MAG: hypothetical protein K0U66_10240, partial [Gammaproteobacteria bacterium]|nr:hypothetical protein [Gammaproteobacteria bacterium]
MPLKISPPPTVPNGIKFSLPLMVEQNSVESPPRTPPLHRAGAAAAGWGLSRHSNGFHTSLTLTHRIMR